MFNLTQQEKLVLLFIFFVTLAGLGINFGIKRIPQLQNLYDKGICLANTIDINKATYDDLVRLPNIGPALANQIIEYRSNNCNFKNIEELKKIKGLAGKRFNQIKDFLSIDKSY